MMTSETKMSESKMSESKDFKNYYEILEVSPNARLRDIENAYQKLALRWHPDKHTADRKLAERKFHSISQAFDVLSDPRKRSSYDQMFDRQSSLEQATKTFQRFYGQNKMMDEQQQEFFSKHYPQKKKNYYKILGLSRNSSMEQITQAYRKLALKYHPKNNPNNQEAARKFIEVNEAYQTLSSQQKKQTYDDLLFGEIVPRRSHDIFEDFFSNKWMDLPSETDFFTPMFSRPRMMRDVDRMMGTPSIMGDKPMWMDKSLSLMDRPLIDRSLLERGITTNIPLGSIKEGESFYRQEKYEKQNDKEKHTAQTTRRKINNGVVEEETVKQNILPTGEREVTKTVKRGDKVDTKQYHLKRNEQPPRELML